MYLPDAFDIQPFGVVVAGVGEAFGQGFAFVLPRVAKPEGFGGLDDVHAVEFDGVAGFVVREQVFVQFFAGADADDLDLGLGGDGAWPGR
jgi:hypothetical protein